MREIIPSMNIIVSHKKKKANMNPTTEKEAFIFSAFILLNTWLAFYNETQSIHKNARWYGHVLKQDVF